MAEDFMPLLGWDHVELWVGNAKQAAFFYEHAMGFGRTAYSGPETGVRDRASYVLEQGEIRFVVTSALREDHEIARHHARHGDGVRDIALAVPAAAEAYREAIRASADDLASWINRGAALLLAGQAKEAVGVLREVLEKDPRQAVALNDLGIAYLREGRTKSAAVNLERAAKHMETPQVARNVAAVQAAAQRAPASIPVSRRRKAKPRIPAAPRASEPPPSRSRRAPARPRKRRPAVPGKRTRRPATRPRKRRPAPRRPTSHAKARRKPRTRRRPRTRGRPRGRRRGPRRA